MTPQGLPFLGLAPYLAPYRYYRSIREILRYRAF